MIDIALSGAGDNSFPAWNDHGNTNLIWAFIDTKTAIKFFGFDFGDFKVLRRESRVFYNPLNEFSCNGLGEYGTIGIFET